MKPPMLCPTTTLSRIVYRMWLVLVVWVSLFSAWQLSTASASEVLATVVAVDGEKLSLKTIVPHEPKVGDEVVILVTVPEVGEAEVATAHVTEVRDGVVSAKIVKATGKVRAGFTARINSAEQTVQPQIAAAPPKQAAIGAKLEAVDDRLAKLFQLEQTTGLAVLEVPAGSPAEQAGLKKFDVLLTLGGEKLESLEQFAASLQKLAPGDELTFEVWRDAKQQTIKVTAGEYVASSAVANSVPSVRPPVASPPAVSDVPPATPLTAPSPPVETASSTGTAAAEPKAWLGINPLVTTRGVRARLVYPDSPASRGGLRRDDVIVSIEGEVVRTDKEFMGKVGSLKPDQMADLEILRQGKKQKLSLRMSPRPEPKALFEAIKKRAGQGSSQDLVLMGLAYSGALGVEKDLPESVDWYRKAAEQGDAEGQCRLGLAYNNGDGVDRNDTEAIKWYDKAAFQGHPEAIYLLGSLYFYGSAPAVTQDVEQGIKWLRSAADKNVVAAHYRLGLAHRDGSGVTQDNSQALRFLKKAADCGFGAAQYELFTMYRDGNGVSVDDEQATAWLEKSAAVGYEKAVEELHLRNTSTIAGGEADKVGESLGLTSESGSLPVWTNPSAQSGAQLSDAVRRYERGVLMVGSPKAGHGTGFVISRKHRLIATNAHVADIKHAAGGTLLAALNGSNNVYTVDKIWYHPGTLRKVDSTGSAIVRSMDPRDGDTFPMGPDVAVLQLSSSGPELPIEFTLATPQEVQSLFGQPIGMLGYPGHSSRWIQQGELPQGTFHEGVVSRLTDFNMGTTARGSLSQFLQHTAPNWGGFSGSPLFLPNGRVAALHNSGRHIQTATDATTLAYGVRIDCLWELLAYHKLSGMVPVPIDKAVLDLGRFDKPDPQMEKWRTVSQLMAEAYDLQNRAEFAEAAKKCKEVIRLMPKYPVVYLLRQELFINYSFAYQNELTPTAYTEQVRLAMNDVQTYLKLAPSDPWGMIRYAVSLNNLAAAEFRNNLPQTQYEGRRREAIQVLNNLIGSGKLNNSQMAECYSSRGMAYAGLMANDEARRDLDEAVRLLPEEPAYYENRASFFDYAGSASQAQSDRRIAKDLRARRIKP